MTCLETHAVVTQHPIDNNPHDWRHKAASRALPLLLASCRPHIQGLECSQPHSAATHSPSAVPTFRRWFTNMTRPAVLP
ncbi:hypothetical protein E2C01_070007 [Portunus trituberculatus]|uniref:Uncharacterized protein n=1 Tax=Portunus trituberculatus TaxID=210409 RepID=A0A5B7I0Z8_PORTR|nr:hypothetical protein [Portunus trituberculatus]